MPVDTGLSYSDSSVICSKTKRDPKSRIFQFCGDPRDIIEFSSPENMFGYLCLLL